jgi:hypothetical protein
MIVRKQSNGELILIGQTEHSRFVGQLAAHWGNRDFASPQPYESVVRAAVYHDYGWLSYETNPIINPETGETYEFRGMPFNPRQLESYQSCIDWLEGIDPYTALIVSMHRTGLWQGRYHKITHPVTKYSPQNIRPEIWEFVKRNERRQEEQRSFWDQNEIWTNYCLQQVWDLLGLYFCCQEPYDEHIEPVPASYDASKEHVKLTMKPVDDRKVKIEPFPFDRWSLGVQITCKRLPTEKFRDLEAFRRSYFQAPTELITYELV